MRVTEAGGRFLADCHRIDGPEVAGFGAAERIWRIEIESIVRREHALARRLRSTQRSKESLATGSWALGDPGRSALGRQAPGA